MAPSSNTGPKGPAWTRSLYRAIRDYQLTLIDLDQFKARLVKLDFPRGYIDWLIYMMTRT